MCSVAVAGDIRTMLPKGQSPGANISFGPPNPRWGPLDPLGSLADVDFLSGFRPRGTDQSSAERIKAPQDETTSRNTDQGSQDESGPLGTNQGPWNRSGPRWTNQGTAIRIRDPRDGSGTRRTNQDLPIRVRASQGKSGMAGHTGANPARQIRSCRTN